jgi:hypothetical protein
MTPNATSPASTGPAGAYFEGQVGAHYLLSILTASEPRGLPGTAIDRIELQRAGEGRPLDDIVIHAHDARGDPAVLEIQVKRTISFAPSDLVFRAVVGQIVEASRRAEVWTSRYQFAIATARTSRKIDCAYQEVLTWARQLDDAAAFLDRIERQGSANDDMRTFVRTFMANLRHAGSPDDPQTVWELLRRFQILVFDFTVGGSASEELARERAVRALHADDTLHAPNLWTALVELALQIAASGGDRTRDRLIGDLRNQPFRLAGERRHSSALAALAEASRNALADISDRIGDVMLTRHARVAAVHAALDGSRYVEVRGDAGVGKSGILKHFAEQIATEARVIVLRPGRTIPKGWTAMRAVLGFDGTARELLIDLAGGGGSVIFVDNLDAFDDDDERRTVVDLVREAATVPGFAVVATARRNFDVDEPNWLPPDVLDRLGRAPIVIGEMSDAEVEEMRHAAPRLAALLAATHPARDVTRNLFRLARLASHRREPVPRTEADMAEHWWRTADGKPDANHRDRARVLRALAEQALARAEPLDVRDCPAWAVDALVESETLRDLQNDRVAFRHDVLREWAIANLLHSEPAAVERLPLQRPAPAPLARGLELVSCMVLERAVDITRWQAFLERVSHEDAHRSWRRAALLALVRSEVSLELLTRASDLLFASRASMLTEIIRIVMAVDVEPATGFLAAIGVDPAMIPATLNIPSGSSWQRLIRWLLSLGQTLPAAAIPDVVDLYTAWSRGTLGHDPLTPLLLQWLYRWLTEIEEARDAETVHAPRGPFSGQFTYERIGSLESELRSGFLLFCNRTPALAVQYLRELRQRRRSDQAVRSILSFRGSSLAQAAPADLAELTAAALIPNPPPYEDEHRRALMGPFGFADHDFLPASPTQGPFLELLAHAPHHALSLIQRLVGHAISFYCRDREFGADAILIAFGHGERIFPWRHSYTWSRNPGASYCVTSALMALEVWAHGRIEAGETFEAVLADVLGPAGSPAAHILVAVDILLSHWPKSREAAIPFLACPELLCIDRQRGLYDHLEIRNILGLRALKSEPLGAASLEDLNKRASRRRTLDQVLGEYAVYGPTALREKLALLLRQAAVRLGPPAEQADLAEPAFMVVHALNLLEPNNWPEVSVTLPDGTQGLVRRYQSPPAESRHFAALQEGAQSRVAEANMQASLGLALEDPSRSSPEFAAAAVQWAQGVSVTPNDEADEDPDDDRTREHDVVTAAMIAMRDGTPELRAQHERWARGVFVRALQTETDPIYRSRSGLRFNPIAIAFVGMIHLLKHRTAPGDVRAVLEMATGDEPAAAHGFSVASTTLASIDQRLPSAVLRCAFQACIQPGRGWRVPEREVTARAQCRQQRLNAAIDAELRWLANEGPEPPWPAFPSQPARPRPGLRLRAGRIRTDEPTVQQSPPDQYADHQAAAVWIQQARTLFDVAARPWLREIARTYAAWTADANGARLDVNEEVTNPPSEWNHAYFDLLAHCLPGLPSSEVELLVLSPLSTLPDKAFFDVLTPFVRSVDAVYFSDTGLEQTAAVTIRTALAHRLMASSGWTRLAGSRTGSIEVHIGSAIAALFFNDYSVFQPPQSYLLPQGIDRLGPFLSVLEPLVMRGPCVFVAVVTLNLLEVSPSSAHLPFVVAAAKSWLETYADDTDFWVDYEIGRRLCVWIETVRLPAAALLQTESAVRSDLDRILGTLVNAGVAEARRLEKALAGGSGGGR